MKRSFKKMKVEKKMDEKEKVKTIVELLQKHYKVYDRLAEI